MPSKLHILRGNPGRRALIQDEPEPEVGASKCPPHIGSRAEKEWNRIIPELERLGLITEIDMAALAAYCACYARWQRAELKVKREGEYYKVRDERRKHPALTVIDSTLKQMRAFLSEFGLSPSSRTRVARSGTAKKGSKDPWEDM